MFNNSSKTHTLGNRVVNKIVILYTPYNPRYLFLLFLIFIFSFKSLLFSAEPIESSLEYKKLKTKDLLLISGFIPEFSYDILGNSFSLKLSLNSLVSNSLALYENQLDKEILKNKYFENIIEENKNKAELILSENIIYEKKSQKTLYEINAIELEIISLNNLIKHKKELLVLNQEIFEYHESQFVAGKLNTIEFLNYKKSYLEIVYDYQVLLYNREVLTNEENSKRSEISDSK